ncbi:phospholipid scramblase-related protein [Streptomyces sp. NPDC101150]|uniref:phospholipid scramblase-related protein n=1 Tax=Streptomyces sp. NPDC101150 TaxID=3366114 RepID=UPI00380802D0
MTQNAVPQGWYQDPYGTPVLRWWDGYRWTEHTQATPAPTPAPAPAQAAVPPQQAYPQAPVQQAPAQQQGYPPAQAQQPYAPAPAQTQQPYPQAPAQQQGYPPAQTQQPYAPQAQQPYPPAQVPQQQFPQQQPQQFPQQFQQPHPQMGGGPGPEALLSADLLLVEQDFKWVDITTSYGIRDRNGNEVGSVAETGQNAARKALRFVSSMDRYLSRKFEIRDAAGVPFLVLSRGVKVVKSRVAVERPDGTPVGEIVQDTVIGHVSFDLIAGGQTLGQIKAEGWYAFTFTITDHTGAEVARIGRGVLDIVLDIIGGSDFYHLQVLRPLPEPLRTLVIAAALTVNTMLRPDKDGNA